MDLKDIAIKKDDLKKIAKNITYNDIIREYYNRLRLETKDEKISNKIEKITDCNKLWFMDYYQQQKIKDFKKTNLCNDKFCSNCKKVKQALRMSKFIPLIRPYAKDLYQLTLTIPNVKGEELTGAIRKIFKAFATLIEYLKGKKKLAGIDFSLLGYEGAIRSLEITFKGNSYHPHIHALIILKGDPGEQKNKNVYSIDFKGKRKQRLFNDTEILIQKIWYLLINGERVTLRAIQNVKKGYSCQLDKSKESDFIEIFKYMTKTTDEEEKTLSYRQFKILHSSLNRVRQIQGYGCFYGLKDEEKFSQEDLDKAIESYNLFIEKLREKEKPIQTAESPNELSKDKENTIISRKTYTKDFLQTLQD